MSTFFNLEPAAANWSANDKGAALEGATRGGAGPRLAVGTDGLGPVEGGAGGPPLAAGPPRPPGA